MTTDNYDCKKYGYQILIFKNLNYKFMGGEGMPILTYRIKFSVL